VREKFGMLEKRNRLHRQPIVATSLLVMAIACSRNEEPRPPSAGASQSPPSGTELNAGAIAPTDESLLEAFIEEFIPRVPRVGQTGSHLLPLTWTWQGEARMGQDERSPFESTVTVTSVRIEKTEDAVDGPIYYGVVSWNCKGKGAYRCFENRYSREETRYEYDPDAQTWHRLRTQHRNQRDVALPR